MTLSPFANYRPSICLLLKTTRQTLNRALHNDVSTTMIYTHVLRQGGSGMKSPLDCL
jgi:hypothetical protein